MSGFRAASFAILASLLGCASSGPPETESTTVHGADIPAYATFGWPAEAANPATAAPTTILDTRVRGAITAELISKGYIESDDTPDFLVSFELTTYEVAPKSSSPVRIGVGVGSWGGNVGGSVGTSVGVGANESGRVQTRLNVRAVDAASRNEVWVGTTTRDIKQGMDQRAVDSAIAAIMEGFPARRR